MVYIYILHIYSNDILGWSSTNSMMKVVSKSRPRSLGIPESAAPQIKVHRNVSQWEFRPTSTWATQRRLSETTADGEKQENSFRTFYSAENPVSSINLSVLVPRAEKVNCFCHVNCKTHDDVKMLCSWSPRWNINIEIHTHAASRMLNRPLVSASRHCSPQLQYIFNLLMQNYICKVYFSKRNKVKHIMFWLMPTWLFTFIPTRKPLTGFLISSVPSKILIINNLGSNK